MNPMMIAVFAAMIAVYYAAIIRPQRKRAKAVTAMRSGLRRGDKITTIGGLVGTVVHVDDDSVVFETSEDRVRIHVTKWAVSNTGDPAAQPPQ